MTLPQIYPGFDDPDSIQIIDRHGVDMTCSLFVDRIDISVSLDGPEVTMHIYPESWTMTCPSSFAHDVIVRGTDGYRLLDGFPATRVVQTVEVGKPTMICVTFRARILSSRLPTNKKVTTTGVSR